VTLPGRQLGLAGSVSAIGFGAFFREPLDTATAERTFIDAIEHALDRGITLVDTSPAYGADGHSERLVGRALRGRREGVLVSTKFGNRKAVVATPDGLQSVPMGGGRAMRGPFGTTTQVDCSPAAIREELDGSLRRLGLDYVDLYSPHFPDPGVPIEEIAGTVAELISAGKVRHLGLSNVDADLLRRAHAVHPVAAVQNLYSVGERTPETDVLPAGRELGVGFVCWGPLALREAPLLTDAAEAAGMSVQQLALAWLLQRAPDVVPIPGMLLREQVDDDLAALDLDLDDKTLAALDALPWEPQPRPWLEDCRARPA